MASFDKTTVKFLQNPYFHINVLKFVLGCIPIFDAKIYVMKNKDDDTIFNTKWYFKQELHLKQ